MIIGKFKIGSIISNKIKILDINEEKKELIVENLTTKKKGIIKEELFFNSYFKEIKNIEDIKLEKTCFSIISPKHFLVADYRVDGFYFIYETSDGKRYEAPTTKDKANGISGVGVSGIIIKLDNPNLFILKRETPFNQERVLKDEETYIKRVNESQNIGKFEFLKNLKPGLSSIEVEGFFKEEQEKRFDDSIKKYQEDNLEKINIKKVFGIEMDTRKTLNRNPDIKLSDYVSSITEITDKGLTIEKIEEILSKNKDKEKILFKYLTQITLHLTVDEKFKKGFKEDNLIFNENGTLGVKYNGIDINKKFRIYEQLRDLDGWSIYKDSNSWIVKKVRRIDDKEEGLKIVKEFGAVIERTDKDLFGGRLEAGVVSIPMLGLVAFLELNISYIYEKNIGELLLQLLGTDKEGFITKTQNFVKEQEEKLAKAEIKRLELEKKWKQEKDDSIKTINELIENIKNKLNVDFSVIGDLLKINNLIGIRKNGEIIHLKKKGTQVYFKKIPFLNMDTMAELNSIIKIGKDDYVKLLKNDFKYNNSQYKFKNIIIKGTDKERIFKRYSEIEIIELFKD